MTTAYTSLLGLALPVTGELSGTWGDTVNNYITSYLDAAVAGAQTISGTQTAVTLSVTNGSSLSQAGSGATGSSQYQIINCTGNPASLLTITVPAASKVYLVLNSTSTSQSVKIVGAGPTTGVTVISGEKALVAWNGSDFVKVATAGGSSTFSNVTVTGTTTLSGLTASTALALDASKNVVSVTNTGTGNNVLSASPTLTGTVAGASLTLSSLTSGRVTYAGASGLLQDSANLTFDGTTLTAANITSSGTWTFSGGTANGVLYLNGSKVATSGSALTWDGTTLTATNASAGNYYSSAAAFRIGYSASYPYIDLYGSAGNIIAFGIAASEAMRLTSTGLGIGTSSPGGKLEVYSGASGATAVSNGTNLIIQNSTAVGMSLLAPDANACRIYFGTASNNRNAFIYSDYNSGAQTLIFGVGTSTVAATERMRIDSSGNLGLGVTPPTGSNQAGIFLSGTNNVFGGAGNGASFTSNVYNSSGTWKYATSSFATLYQQTSGQHVFYTAASGTATNNISWTQAMTLFASGGLSLGNTSDPGAGNVNVSGNISLVTNGTSFQWTNSGNNVAINGASGVLAFYTGTSAYNERARIDSAGNLGLGVTPNGSWKFEASNGSSDVQGRFVKSGTDSYAWGVDSSGSWSGAGGSLSFRTGGFTSASERARIDSSGNLLVGTTSTGLTNSNSITLEAPGGAQVINHPNGTATGAYYVIFGYNAGLIGSITQNGTTGVLYNITSDPRLKTLVGAVTGSGERIDALQPVEFDWKASGKRARGFFADKFQEVYPSSVTGEKDGVDAEGNPVYQQMQASTAEVIADLVAELQSLRKRVAQLEKGN